MNILKENAKFLEIKYHKPAAQQQEIDLLEAKIRTLAQEKMLKLAEKA